MSDTYQQYEHAQDQLFTLERAQHTLNDARSYADSVLVKLEEITNTVATSSELAARLLVDILNAESDWLTAKTDTVREETRRLWLASKE